MIIYNITCKIRWGILEPWLQWQLGEQIPATLATGFFDEHRLYRLLEQEEEEGPTFVIQFFSTSLERYQRFGREFALPLQQVAWDKWGDGFIAFRTVMESMPGAD